MFHIFAIYNLMDATKNERFPPFQLKMNALRRLPKKEWRLLETFVERCYGPLS